jgi:hypothetical protein
MPEFGPGAGFAQQFEFEPFLAPAWRSRDQSPLLHIPLALAMNFRHQRTCSIKTGRPSAAASSSTERATPGVQRRDTSGIPEHFSKVWVPPNNPYFMC